MDAHYEKLVQNAMNAIKELGHEEFVRNFDDNTTGFIWSADSRVTEIGNKLLEDGHSGASFACTLRECQRRLKNNNNLNNKDIDDLCDSVLEDMDDLISKSEKILSLESPPLSPSSLFPLSPPTPPK